MFTLTIDTGNAAFDDAGPELARILRELAARLEPGLTCDGGADVRDTNGNRVGSWGFKAPKEPETLAAFIERHQLEMTVDKITARPDGWSEEWPGARHYVVTLKRVGFGPPAPVAFFYSQGSAHTKGPKLADVLDALAGDAASYLNARDADDMAAELGVESPREAVRLWEACRETAAKLETLLGSKAEVQALAFETERL